MNSALITAWSRAHHQHRHQERHVRLLLKRQSAKRETCPALYASSKQTLITTGERTSQKTKKPFTVEELMEKGLTKVG
jgi:hypothetical protein